jgi:hypothetical protein
MGGRKTLEELLGFARFGEGVAHLDETHGDGVLLCGGHGDDGAEARARAAA